MLKAWGSSQSAAVSSGAAFQSAVGLCGGLCRAGVFVGIAVPYLMRALFQTNAPIVLIPACFLGGALCCQVCDMIARTVFAPTELSISTVTAIFGAPIVLVMMVRRRRDGL